MLVKMDGVVVRIVETEPVNRDEMLEEISRLEKALADAKQELAAFDKAAGGAQPTEQPVAKPSPQPKPEPAPQPTPAAQPQPAPKPVEEPAQGIVVG